MKKSSFGHVRPRTTKTGKTHHQASYVNPTTNKRTTKTFTSKSEANRWLKEIHQQILTGNQPETPQPDTTQTINDYAQSWITKLENNGASPNTIRSYLSTLRRYINPTLGDQPLTSLTKTHCATWYDNLPANKPGARRNAYLTLLSLLNHAKDEELINQVPLNIKGAVKKTSTRNEDRERVATPDQVQQIATLMPPNLAITVLIAGFMGLRYSEIAALRRRHVDLKNKQLKIRAGIKRNQHGQLVEGPPKTERSIRNVPISKRMHQALQNHLDNHVPPGQDSLLVHSSTSPARFLSNKTLHIHYDRAVAEVGLPGFGFHQLRATCATLLMRTGATPAEIQAILGHSDWATSQLYQRAPKERLSQVMDNIS